MRLDPPNVRIERLAESIAIIKGLFGDGPVSFHGKHYQIDHLEGYPKPAQAPHPPILIGGGARRILGLAGREADIVGINVSLESGKIDYKQLGRTEPPQRPRRSCPGYGRPRATGLVTWS